MRWQTSIWMLKRTSCPSQSPLRILVGLCARVLRVPVRYMFLKSSRYRTLIDIFITANWPILPGCLVCSFVDRIIRKNKELHWWTSCRLLYSCLHKEGVKLTDSLKVQIMKNPLHKRDAKLRLSDTLWAKVKVTLKTYTVAAPDLSAYLYHFGFGACGG